MSSWSARLQDKAAEHFTHRINLYHFGFLRNFTMGLGMGWAVQQEKYWHLPIAFMWASPYAGYQLFKHRASAVSWARENLTIEFTTQRQLNTLLN